MKTVSITLCILLSCFFSRSLVAQSEFVEDGIRYIEVTSLQQFAELSCDLKAGTDELSELPEILQTILSGEVGSALAGCYGKRGKKKCKKSGGLCVKSTKLNFDQQGNISEFEGGMVDENGNFIDAPGAGKLYYGLDEYGEVVVTFRTL